MTDSFGYGQQRPEDTATDLGAIEAIVRAMMAEMVTTKLVRVEAVTGGGAAAGPGTVNVLPLVSQIDSNGNATPHGVVNGIPWWRLQGGANAVVCDPVVGDVGYVVAADRDISSLKATGKQGPPPSRRKFSIEDGVYVGGCLNAAPTQYVAFLAAGGGIELVVPGGAQITLGPTSIVLAFGANNVTIDATGIHLNGPIAGGVSGVAGTINFGATNLTTTGLITSNGKVLSTHVHGGVTTGAGSTAPPT